jgi:cytochrome c-type protein NapC
MDLTKQTDRAADIHSRFLLPGEATCIDCHKGIAHELPDMTGVEPGWRAPPELRDRPVPEASLGLQDSLAAYLRDRRL